MKIVDSHVHLYPEPILEKECNIPRELVNKFLYELSQKLVNKKISQAIVYILDKNVLSMEMKVPKNIIISTVVDNINDLEKAYDKKIKIIKILPYEQKILRKKYSSIIEIAEFIKEKKMILTICSTYGSKLLYDVNGVELAAYIKKEIDVPIILAHGGGPKIFDAMSIALEYDNIFLDLSFSLKFWWNSSVIKNYAFALKKLECKRCFYGSDYPYVNFDESLDYFFKFIRKYKFSHEETNNILYFNFNKFKEVYL